MTDDLVNAAREALAGKTAQQFDAGAAKLVTMMGDRIVALEAEVARLKAASVITGPGEAARILLEASGGSMPLEAKMAAVKAVIAREGKCQPARVVQAWQAALEALIASPGKEVMPDDFDTGRNSNSHDAAPASTQAGGGAEIEEA